LASNRRASPAFALVCIKKEESLWVNVTTGLVATLHLRQQAVRVGLIKIASTDSQIFGAWSFHASAACVLKNQHLIDQ
jgi:hypothetical protein